MNTYFYIITLQEYILSYGKLTYTKYTKEDKKKYFTLHNSTSQFVLRLSFHFLTKILLYPLQNSG
ncbi:MAG: hypothetical protein D3906_07670 [Candidatus Electrothrix sp. AUS1_2]|nr:hypothetical protein [Candidatus Electrothrix sp. AUS1_2]